MSAEEVAKAFVQHFYQAFDADASALGGLFVSRCDLALDSTSSKYRMLLRLPYL